MLEEADGRCVRAETELRQMWAAMAAARDEAASRGAEAEAAAHDAAVANAARAAREAEVAEAQAARLEMGGRLETSEVTLRVRRPSPLGSWRVASAAPTATLPPTLPELEPPTLQPVAT